MAATNTTTTTITACMTQSDTSLLFNRECLFYEVAFHFDFEMERDVGTLPLDVGTVVIQYQHLVIQSTNVTLLSKGNIDTLSPEYIVPMLPSSPRVAFVKQGPQTFGLFLFNHDFNH